MIRLAREIHLRCSPGKFQKGGALLQVSADVEPLSLLAFGYFRRGLRESSRTLQRL